MTPIITGRQNADARKTHALHDGGETAGEQIGAYQEGDLLRREVHCTPNDQGNRDCARIHNEDMLNRQRHQSGDRKAFVYRVDAVGHSVTSSATFAAMRRTADSLSPGDGPGCWPTRNFWTTIASWWFLE